MLVTSRMWRSMRWTRAVWWGASQVEAQAGEQRPGRPTPLPVTFQRERLLLVRTFSSRPIRRWPCLIRRNRVEAVAAAEEEEEEVVAVAAEAVEPVEAEVV